MNGRGEDERGTRPAAGAMLQALVALAMGALCVRLALTGELVRYVKSSLRPWLLIAGVVIAVAALSQLVGRRRPPAAAGPQHDQHEHEHEHHDRAPHSWGHVGVLLALPLVAIVAIAPPPLGSFALRRNDVVVTRGRRASFPPFVHSRDPLVMSLYEVTARVAQDGIEALAGQQLKLRGFIVTGSAKDDTVQLARFRIACCAADAAASVVELVLDRPAPAGDTWVTVVAEVTGRRTEKGAVLARLRVDTIDAIATPADPYEEV